VDDTVTIKHPSTSNVGPKKRVPLLFVAAGTAKGTAIDKVRGAARLLDSLGNPTGPEYPGKFWFFVPKKAADGNKHRWMMHFQVPQTGKYRLDVVGVNAQGADIQQSAHSVGSFEVGSGFGGPQVAYPLAGATITGAEKDYFVAYGSSTRPILFATVGTEDTAEYNYFDETINFFGSQFPPLHSSGTVTLTIVDYQGQSDARALNVV
jgi:hypothetical protein